MNRLKEIMQNSSVRYTQRGLAKVLNISPSAVNFWVNNKNDPDTEIAKQICQIYGVSLSYLMMDDNGDEVEDELNQYLEELRTRPELRMMFSLTSKANKEDVEKAVRIIEALLKEDK